MNRNQETRLNAQRIGLLIALSTFIAAQPLRDPHGDPHRNGAPSPRTNYQ